MSKSTAVSIRRRLLNLAKENHENFDYVLRQYLMQRLLYRLSISEVELGVANRRLKDFYDLWIISRQFDLDGHILAKAISVTFERRGTRIDTNALTLFSDSFKNNKQKEIQWNAFLNKNGLVQKESFSEIVTSIESFLFPLYQSLSDQQDFSLVWSCKSEVWG